MVSRKRAGSRLPLRAFRDNMVPIVPGCTVTGESQLNARQPTRLPSRVTARAAPATEPRDMALIPDGGRG